jgi:hypothetical protein
MAKKVLFLIAASFVLIGALTGCGSDVTASKPLEDIYSEIEQKVTLPEMLDLNSDNLVTFMGIKQELYSESSAHIALEAVLGDMILMFKAADKASLDTLKTKIENYRSQRLNEMDNYLPAEYDKINRSEVTQKGLYVWLVVSDDADAILSVINQNIK